MRLFIMEKTQKTKAEKDLEKFEKKGALSSEFKKFITKGNVIDMAVGVIMGNAFGAIVTAFTNILLSVCTWGVPGGLKGLVTVLPALNSAQSGMDPINGLGQKFSASELQNLAKTEATVLYGTQIESTPTLIENVKSTILSKYTLHGTTYTYNMSSIIDWGTFLNAIIAFLIIAVTLFTIIKTVNAIKVKRLAFEAELNARKFAAWEEAHPEAAELKKKKEAEAALKAKEAASKKPDDIVLLTQIKEGIERLNNQTK